MVVKMIQRIITVIGCCLIAVSHQMNYQQALLLSNITSIEQLFAVARIQANGRTIHSPSEVLPQLQTHGDQVYVGMGMAELAMPDECMPRLTTVEISREDVEDVNVQLWPRCTRIKRCGGCCANNMLKCVPKTTAIRPLMVLKARLWDSGASDLMMDWEGYMQVEVEEHTSCDIVCRITSEDCNRRQLFYDSECQCRCRVERRRCSPLQRWDPETCRCVCKNPNRTCRRGSTFNPRNCRCRISRIRQTYASLNRPTEHQDISLRNRNLGDDSDGNDDGTTEAQPTPSTTIPFTPTTPTTPTTTVFNPCAPPFFCPPSFEKVVSGGGCVCFPAFSFPRRGRT